MRLRILTLTYPLMPLTPDACGGVEQIGHTLLHRLAAMHSDSAPFLITLADSRSRIPGKLMACDDAPDSAPAETRLSRRADTMLKLASTLTAEIDLIHLQGFNDWRPIVSWGKPTLLSLHMAFELYPRGWLNSPPPNLTLQCVSHSQSNWLAEHLSLQRDPMQKQEVVCNGIELDRFEWRRTRGDYWLYLGRICPEKGVHTAIELARLRQRRLLLAGSVYPFPSHQEYFRQKIAPQIGSEVVWLDAVNFQQKVELLARAAAVLICTEVDEPSSLAAMEAAASGAPVLALRRGALAEIVAQNESGILADDFEGLLSSSNRLSSISPAACRQYAERHFSAGEMAENYWRLYHRMLGMGERRVLQLAG